MNPKFNSIRRVLIPAAGLLAAILLASCSSPANGDSKPKTGSEAKTATGNVSRKGDPGIILQFAADRVQKPSAPFHWSLKKNVTGFGASDWEADVRPDSITGTVLDTSGSRPLHAVRSDTSAWNTAVLVLTGPLPASTFALVVNSPATVRDGTETLNGEQTVKYSIDTGRNSDADASLIKSVLGPSGFVKGAVWVTAEGCPVKFFLDVEQHSRNGEVQKEHFEEAILHP